MGHWSRWFQHLSSTGNIRLGNIGIRWGRCVYLKTGWFTSPRATNLNESAFLCFFLQKIGWINEGINSAASWSHLVLLWFSFYQRIAINLELQKQQSNENALSCGLAGSRFSQWSSGSMGFWARIEGRMNAEMNLLKLRYQTLDRSGLWLKWPWDWKSVTWPRLWNFMCCMDLYWFIFLKLK